MITIRNLSMKQMYILMFALDEYIASQTRMGRRFVDEGREEMAATYFDRARSATHMRKRCQQVIMAEERRQEG